MTTRPRYAMAFVLPLLVLAVSARAASIGGDGSVFRDLNAREHQSLAAPASERWIHPLHYRPLSVDAARLAALLDKAPLEGTVEASASPVVLSLPMPDGTWQRFRVTESPIMGPELQAAWPEIRTFSATGLDDTLARGRLDLTPQGFHAILFFSGETVYIDPLLAKDPGTLQSYYKRNSVRREGVGFSCGAGQGPAKNRPAPQEAPKTPANVTTPLESPTSLRVFRTAISATSGYVAYFNGEAGAQAAIVTLLNRVNGIYEKDLSIRLSLVKSLLFNDPATDPYKGLTTEQAFAKNQEVLDQQVGTANYDVGHVVGSEGGGGLGSLAGVCDPKEKGKGLTFSDKPVGDSFVVDFVAHEFGHQFGANHSYNGFQGGACTTRVAETAYEPYSGSTIMSYTEICEGQDLAPASDDYFHAVSLKEMLSNTLPGGQSLCAPATGGTNNPPTVTAPQGFTIPAKTPFALTAQGDDPDPQDKANLTYCWEEYDLGDPNPVGSNPDDGKRPIVRSYAPSPSPTRTVPLLKYILANTNEPPQTYTVPGKEKTYYTGEQLPSVDRRMQFRVTVRDNRAADGKVAGAVASADTFLTVVGSAGPFRVTSPNDSTTWAAGTAHSVTWDVAKTDKNPINTTNVRITLSTDSGRTFPVVLAESVSNTGSAQVTVPSSIGATSNARVRVEAVGNIFFDVSDVDFNITASGGQPSELTAAFTFAPSAPKAGDTVQFTDRSTGATSWNWSFGDGAASTERNPTRAFAAAGTYVVELTVSNGTETRAVSQTVTVTGGTAGQANAVLFVPVILSATGANAFYTSELTFTNRGSSDASVELTYTGSVGGGGGAARFTLASGKQRIEPDAMAFLRSLNPDIVPDSGARIGTLRVTFSGVSSASAAAVTVRTANSQLPGGLAGRAGLAYAGVPTNQLLTGSSYLFGLRQNGSDRSNVGLQNAGTSGNITLRLTVISGRSQTALPDITLPPGGWQAVNSILQSNGLALDSGFVRIDRVDGTSPYYAYAVINDQSNSDGSFVAPVPAAEEGGKTGSVVPVIVSASPYASELVLANYGSAAKTVTATLVATSLEGGQASTVITLEPGQQQIIPDFVQYLRDASTPGVPASGAVIGPLFLTTSDGDARGLFFGARTSSPGGGGRFGVFYSEYPAGSGAKGSAWLYGLQQNGENRTNVAFVNTGEVDGSSSTYQIDVFDGATGALASSTTQDVAARQFVQINTILTKLAPGVEQGFARITRKTGKNPFITYAVINDGAAPQQRTDDGAFVQSVPEPALE